MGLALLDHQLDGLPKSFYTLINKLNAILKIHYDPFTLCGPGDKNLSDEITNNMNNNNCLSLCMIRKLRKLLPILCAADMYVGNDSSGPSHVTAQSGIKSLVILLDTPKAYTDYSKNYHRIVPDGS